MPHMSQSTSSSFLANLWSPVDQILREAAGYLIVVIFGIGLFYFQMFFVSTTSPLFLMVAPLTLLMSFVFFRLLETNFWFSKFIGLTIYPSSTPTKRALGLTFLGLIWLWIRSMPPSASKQSGKDGAKKIEEPRDTPREVAETVVFVVVLVLMLKLFVAEAFVIPTGSMATTLYGNQKEAVCEECGFSFPVNAADEVDPPGGGAPRPVIGYTCPNCNHSGSWTRETIPPVNTGDRVLVFKPEYHMVMPHRFDVPVFKYPKEPQQNWVAMNFIKRMIGLPGETIAIYHGDVYVGNLRYLEDERDPVTGELLYPRPERDVDLWERQYTYMRRYQDAKILRDYDFRILRKAPGQMLALSRPVYDNDHQPKSLKGKIRPRWFPEERPAWTFDDDKAPRVFTVNSPDELSWLHYQHLVPDWQNPEQTAPSLIKNVLGYNAGQQTNNPEPGSENQPTKWVGDLILEAEVESATGQGEVVFELSRSVDRFQARFNLETGDCTLVRLRDGKEVELVTLPTRVKGAGRHQVRFSNVDHQLRVWVGAEHVDFGTAAEYTPPPLPVNFDVDDFNQEGWVRANDLMRPASIGVKGKVVIRHIKLSRDTHYTYSGTGVVEAYYVQPGHYFVLGDNSASSSDSRYWGTVPDRLLLGRALLVYYPIPRIGLIK